MKRTWVVPILSTKYRLTCTVWDTKTQVEESTSSAWCISLGATTTGPVESGLVHMIGDALRPLCRGLLSQRVTRVPYKPDYPSTKSP